MPTRSEYEHLTLGAAVRRLAEHHYAERTRHLSHDEYELLQRAADMDWSWLEGVRRLGITAGASAPETLVDELVAACRDRYEVTVEEVRTIEENVVFKLPRALVA